MNILIATDGILPVKETTARVERLHQPGDSVAVMTAINLPRNLLNALKVMAAENDVSVEDIVEAAGPGQAGLAGGDRIAERLKKQSQAWPMDEFLKRYFDKVAEEYTLPMVSALREVGIEAQTLVREADNRTAWTIIDVCNDLDIDLLVIGTRGQGRFEGLVGSTGTKLVRHAPCDVLLIRMDG